MYPSHRHDRLQTGSDDQWDLIQETDPPLQPLRPPTIAASQTSSLASVNQTGSPVPSPLPRSTSPFSTSSNIPLLNSKPTKERDQQVLRKKPPATPNGFAAVGILNSLNPTHLEPVSSHEQSDDGYTDVSHREEKDKEKKEKRPFWDRAVHKDKEKEKEKEKERDRTKERERDRDREKEREKDRDRERDRKEDGPPAELTRLLGTSSLLHTHPWYCVCRDTHLPFSPTSVILAMQSPCEFTARIRSRSASSLPSIHLVCTVSDGLPHLPRASNSRLWVHPRIIMRMLCIARSFHLAEATHRSSWLFIFRL